DAQIAAVTVGVARGDGVEQALDDAFIADLRDHLAAGMQVAALAERHQLLDDRAQILRLRQRGDDLLMLDQRHGEVGEHRLAMADAAGEAAAFETVAHGSFPSLAVQEATASDGFPHDRRTGRLSPPALGIHAQYWSS